MTTTEIVNEICKLTTQKLNAWKSHEGYAPSRASDKLNKMMFDWIISLTDALHVWEEKDILMTDGELILACANIGSLVECMMKFVLCVYIEDYRSNPLKDKDDKIVQPEKIKFENLKKYCFDNVWTRDSYTTTKLVDEIHSWVGRIQEKRNSIHAFNRKELGDVFDFSSDIEMYYEFLKLVLSTLPDDPYFEY